MVLERVPEDAVVAVLFSTKKNRNEASVRGHVMYEWPQFHSDSKRRLYVTWRKERSGGWINNVHFPWGHKLSSEPSDAFWRCEDQSPLFVMLIGSSPVEQVVQAASSSARKSRLGDSDSGLFLLILAGRNVAL